jgi:acetyl-CoA C-acetyltransferase
MCQEVYPQVKKLNNVHTGGNSSGVVDGASALFLCSPEYAKAHGLKPRGRIVSGASVGVEPVVMLTGPGPAALKVLKHMGMKVSDIDLWEINEAFASVVLKTIRDLKLDPAIVNVNGGAIALGHPIGATGGILTMTALDELERRNKKTAMISMCTGGAMGSAMIIERV